MKINLFFTSNISRHLLRSKWEEYIYIYLLPDIRGVSERSNISPHFQMSKWEYISPHLLPIYPHLYLTSEV
jgi:hypothetical protein